MAKQTITSWNVVWLRDKSGNEYVCSVDAGKDRIEMSPKDLKECSETSTMAVGGDNH